METEGVVTESRRHLWLRVGVAVAVVLPLLAVIALVTIRRTGRNHLESALARARKAGFPVDRPAVTDRQDKFPYSTGLDELGRTARAKGFTGAQPERRLYHDVRGYAEGRSGKARAVLALQIGKSILSNAERAAVDPRLPRRAYSRVLLDGEWAAAVVWSPFLCARFRLRMEDGDFGAAEADFRRLLALFKMSESQTGYPGKRGSNSYCGAWFHAIQFAANGGGDDRFLRRLLDESRDLKVGDHIGELHHRFATMIDLVEQFRRGKVDLRSLGRYPDPSALKNDYYRFGLDEAEALAIDHAVDLAAAWPDWRQLCDVRDRFEANTKPNPVSPTPALARELVGTFGVRPDAALVWCRMNAQIRCGRIALAAKILSMRSKGVPSLAQAAAFAGVDSKDPFSGDPLVFKTVGKTLLVYSVGPNLVDDGGRSSTVSRSGDDAVCRLRVK